jgi:hypothetical protein
MKPAGMEPLGCERHGWADPRGRVFREKASQAVRHGRKARRVFFKGRKHHKPRLALNNGVNGMNDMAGKAVRATVERIGDCDT